MSNSPFWSVILPTYQRERVLCETIEHLLALSYPNYELLVIDQTPKHEYETEQFLRVHAEKESGRFRWHTIPKPNLPHARNIGAQLATGDFLLYCDDDIIPPVDLIDLHLHNLEQPGIGAATGGNFVEQRKMPARPRPCEILPSGRVFDYWDYEVPKGTTDSLRGGNMSMPRKIVFEAGLFDEAYIGNAYREETDFSLRVLQMGYQIAYDPAAAVVHLGHPTGGSRASKVSDESRYLFEFHHNIAYFFAKNFRQRYLPSFLRRETAWFVKERTDFRGRPKLVFSALQGVWRGYLSGLSKRKSLSS